MLVHQAGEIRYLTSELLDSRHVNHAIFTRHGGVSPPPWDSLNFGSTVGDEIANVKENKRRAFNCMHLDYRAVFDVWQVHGTNVVVAESPRIPGVLYEKADVILTNTKGIVLLMRFADCVPLLIYDPYRQVVGIAHAGWQGTVQGVAKIAIEALHRRFQSNPKDLVVIIGPSIGPDHYHVGSEVVRKVVDVFGQDASQIIRDNEKHTTLDLWSANRIQLEEAGVTEIQVMNVCTACHQNDWYSHRAEQGRTGRFGVCISLRN